MKPIGYYNGAHGFLYDEFDKDCYCQAGCSMEAVYTESQVKKLTGENKVEKLQEQLNTAKKALTEITKMADSGDVTWNEDIKAVTNSALAEIGGEND